jgi:pantoate--beta-alanine ligase
MIDVRRGLDSPVSLMATLGGMHLGHEALLDEARVAGRTLVASLFLNPTQFAADEDLDRYPVDTERDLAIFRAKGVDVLFKPSVEEMYPPGDDAEMDPGPVGDILEGAHRPGHFRGVATVVAKICSTIRPDIAVWGAKDAQQNVVIRHVTKTLGLQVEHRIITTVRDPEGVALSSRNRYLSALEWSAAPVLYQALQGAQELWDSGEVNAAALKASVEAAVASESMVQLDYVSVADPETFTELEPARSGAVVSLAANLGSARLIDNIVLK